MEELLNELNRRKVFRVGATYLVAAWLMVQVAWTITEILSLPDWPAITILALVAIGFPIALATAWFYEFTAEGVRKTEVVDAVGHSRQPGRGLSYGVMAMMTAMIGFLVWDGYIRNNTALEASATAVVPSIAVLPFADMSADGAQEYFADGISEEILNLLAQTNGLRVAARTSSFAFKGRNQDIREIGTALDVKTVLEGSVRSSGDQLRITAQLINAEDGYHIWSETYDRTLDDIFKVQDEISEAILDALKKRLLGTLGDVEMVSTNEKFHGGDLEAGQISAYQQLLMGRERIALRTEGDIKAASRHFRQALEMAPSYAAAHAEYARALLLLEDSNSTYGDLSRTEVDERAVPHIEKAIELNPKLAEAHAVKGLYLMNRGKEQEALSYFSDAIKLNPNYAEAYMWRSMAWNGLGSPSQEIADITKAHKLDPISSVVSFNYTNKLADRGEVEKAMKVARQTVEYNPASLQAAAGYANLQLHIGDYAGAIKTLIALDDRTDDTRVNRMLSNALLAVGLVDAAARYISFENGHLISWAKGDLEGAWALAEIQVDRQPGNIDPLLNVAYYLSELGRTEVAQKTAEKAYQLAQSKEGGNPFFVCNTKLAAAYRDPTHPRVTEMAEKCDELIASNFGHKLKHSGLLESKATMAIIQEKDPATITAALNEAFDKGARSWYLNITSLPDYLTEDPGFQGFMTRLNTDLERQRAEVLPLVKTILAQSALP